MPGLALHLLGPPQIELDGQPIHLGRHKAVALLAYLALTHQPHSRDALATLLWPDFDQSGARGQLRRTLSHLNRTLGDGWLDVDRETAAWADEAEAWIDADILRRRLDACKEHDHPLSEVCPECVPLLRDAVDLYCDGFLAGFTLPDAPGFDEWQFFESEGLRDQVADALQRLARWYDSQEEWDEAIPYARRWLALDPLHEPAHRELMRLYAQSGQQAAALRQYQECERLLGKELAVAPAPETTALLEAIRARQDLTGLTNLSGLRDESAALPRHNLPAQLTPFVGRERELAELERLLDSTAEARLVTVLGPGGMGKTRLALEAASRQVNSYPDGVWFVPFASVQAPEAIASTVAQVLGVSFFGPDPPAQQLLRYLRNKRLLLVLDNLEHLPEGVGLLADLLRAAPGIRIVTTSRTRLNLTGEVVWTLGGMDYPKPDEGGAPAEDVRRHSSVVLFVRSARRAQAGFELHDEDLPHIARICQLAQGMPLAILLAAAWVPALAPAEIATEMERNLDFLATNWRDVPERHHSIRAVFDATWNILSENERQVLARLSVFRGGFTREAAQAVAGADLRALVSMVNRTILQRSRSGRYTVHELLRQYAEGKLHEMPEERKRVFELHGTYYTEFLHSKEMDLWRGYLEERLREIDNIRAAWRWITSHRKSTEIQKCLYSLWCLYQGPGLLQEGEAIFEDAVKALRVECSERADEEQMAALGLALRVQGYFVMSGGQHIDSSLSLAQEGFSILSKLSARREVAFAYSLGDQTLDLAVYIRFLEKGLEMSKALGYYPAAGHALMNLSFVFLRPGLYCKAKECAQELLALCKRFGARTHAGFALASLGHNAFVRGEYGEAQRCYRESLALFRQVGQAWAVGRLYSHLGDVALALGSYKEARECHQNAFTCYEQVRVYWIEERVEIGGCWGIPVSLQRLGDVSLAQGDLADARYQYCLALEAAQDRTEAGLKPHIVLGPARLLAQGENPEQAIELAVLAWHHPESIEETRRRAEKLLTELRAELPADAYAAAEQRGRTRDLEATIRELLAELERPDA